jgi:hypothetical protein
MLSIPILLLLGTSLLLLMRIGGMKITHALAGVMFGAQLAATVVAGGMDAAFTAAGHLIQAVFP